MAFNFGSGSTPAPAPGGGAGGVPAFGAPSTAPPPPSLTSSASLAAAPAPGGFSFGAPTSTLALSAATAPPPPPPPTGGGGFTFGPTSVPTPAATGAAPTPSTGFSFGGAAPTPAAPTPGAAPAPPGAAPPPTTGFSFGSTPAPPPPTLGSGSTPATSATPAGSTFSFSSTNTAAPATANPAAPQQPKQTPTLEVPDFDSVFGNIKIRTEIDKLCRQKTVISEQELVHCIHSNKEELKAKVLDWTAPNTTLRNQLVTRPVISLASSPSAMGPQRGSSYTTTLNRKDMETVLDLATDLRIPEAHAISLYDQVARNAKAIKALVDTNFVERGMGKTKKYTVSKLAREFYFYERQMRLRTLVFLVQSRLENKPSLIQATDILLQDNLVHSLVQSIREYTRKIQQLQQEIAAIRPQMPRSMFPGQVQPPQPPAPPNFGRVHLLFAQDERQLASECLFFVAYHTQLNSQELSSLIDLIRDLSSLAPKPNPFTDVPSPYEPAGTPPTTTNAWPSSSSTPFTYALKEKDPLAWQGDLVQHTYRSGQPQLMQCMSLLIVAAMAAMETRQVLYDRKLHGPNSFGQGNQFVPKDRLSMDGNLELHTLLKPDSGSRWVRKDIWGLLAASYALMLHSAWSLLSSPRGGSSQYSMDIRGCLEDPAEFQSFTFCRMTLMPLIKRLPSSQKSFCNVPEFGLSVLSDFYSHYLAVLVEGPISLPISRLRWKKEQDENLELRRVQQAQQRQYMEWSGKSSSAQEAIPASVDLMDMPDCLDDLVALAASLCSLGVNYAQNFWARDVHGALVVDDDQAPSPSRVMIELERIMSKDESIIPSYLSWLAALANDELSATSIHKLLSRAQDHSQDGRLQTPQHALNWTTLIFNLRWYAQELSPYDANTVSKPTSTTTTTTATTNNTDYYYNLEGKNIPLMSSTTTTTRTTSSGGSSLGSSASSSTKIKELSIPATFRVSSHLAVIMNVSRHSAVAKHSILSVSLPVGDGALSGGDEALLVLFKLAIAPLSPELRGAALGTIASLLVQDTCQIADKAKRAFFLEQAKHAWEYLESCPLLPITVLDQYPRVSYTQAEARGKAGLAFPPSSTSLASGVTNNTLLPKDQQFGILYEMEHVEAAKGWYPSTEGFLRLLKSLVCAAGCPSKLGQHWRPRTGCAPYLEYVTDFVLPRAMGTNGCRCLPFRTKGDQVRMTFHALSVVEAVITRYSIPNKQLKLKSGVDAVTLLGVPSVAGKVCVADRNADPKDLVEDFRRGSVDPHQSFDDADTSGSNALTGTAGSALSIPTAKSPGFAILADLLSAAADSTFQVLAAVLTEHDGPSGMQSCYGAPTDGMALSYALFGSTPPDFASAKEGAKDGGPSKPLQALLKPLVPDMAAATTGSNEFQDAVFEKERTLIVVLRILCAAAAREEDFFKAVTTRKESLTVVPVLRFRTASSLTIKSVSPHRFTDLLFSSSRSESIRQSLVDYVGYIASSDENDSPLAASALALLFFVQKSMSARFTLRDLCGNMSESMLAQSTARRMLECYRRDVVEMETISLTLNWILSELRTGTIAKDGLAQVLLGLPSETFQGNWDPKDKKMPGNPKDCFDAILVLLNGSSFMTSTNASQVTSLCLEIIFRLYDLMKGRGIRALRIVVYTAARLRAVDFWKTNILLWLSHRGVKPLSSVSETDFKDADPNILHSISWLLKGVASELNLLNGMPNDEFVGSYAGLTGMFAPQPAKRDALLSLLFGPDEHIAHKLVTEVPLSLVSVDPTLQPPPTEALEAAAYELPGPKDVTAGYLILNEGKIAQSLKEQHKEGDLQSMREWANQYSKVSCWTCAVSHLSDATCVLFYSALSTSEHFRTGGSYYLSAVPTVPIVGLQASGLVDFLALILQRIFVNARANTHHGMDSQLIPTATRSLGDTALLLADTIATVEQEQAPNAADRLVVASLLAGAIGFSSVGDDSAVEAPIRYERTTVLSSALSMILHPATWAEPALVRQYMGEFQEGIRALERIASFKVDTTSSDEPTSVLSILSRASIATLLRVCGDEEDRQDSWLLDGFFSANFLKSLYDLTVKLDEHVGTLLKSIALQPFGAQLLISHNICNAVKDAAKIYLDEERKVEASLVRQGGNYSKITLQPPAFLISHLRFLSALMTSKTLMKKDTPKLGLAVLDIISVYKDLVSRLCYAFPANGHVLRWFMRCMVQALTLSQPMKGTEQPDFLVDNASRAKRIIGEANLMENGIFMLTGQLLEHPFPSELLPPVPQSMSADEARIESLVVKVAKQGQQSWWDVLDRLSAISPTKGQHAFKAPIGNDEIGFWRARNPKAWDENKFEYAKIAIEILTHSLALTKRLNWVDKLNTLSTARGLYLCTVAAQSVEKRLDEVRQTPGSSFTFVDMMNSVEGNESSDPALELEYLKSLGISYVRCVEELLIASLSLQEFAKENFQHKVPALFRDAVRQSGLDTKGLGCISLTEDGGGTRREFIDQICKKVMKKG